MLVREVRLADRLGLVYSAPFPYLLTQDVADKMGPEKWMVAVLPIELDGALPHQARIDVTTQKAVAAKYVAALVYRAFFANSKLAYDALDVQMAGGVIGQDALNLKTLKTLNEVKAEAEASPVAVLDAATVTATCDAAILAKPAPAEEVKLG